MFSFKDNDLRGSEQVFEARRGRCCKKSLLYIPHRQDPLTAMQT